MSAWTDSLELRTETVGYSFPHVQTQVIDPETGEPFTAHSTNPVPFIACDEKLIGRTLRSGGRLADIAPTMLDIMGIPQPAEMTGKSMIIR